MQTGACRYSRYLPSRTSGGRFSRFLALVLVSVFLVGSVRAEVLTIAYDGFDYPAGALAGRNGGTGWSSAWVLDYGNGSSFYVNETGLTYPDLTTSGGSIEWTNGGFQINENSRTLALQDSGVVYLRFLSQFGSGSGQGTPNIRLYYANALTGGLGGNGGTYGSFMSILGSDLLPAADGSSSTDALLSALNLVIVRIDYAANSTSMWVNPDLAAFDYEDPGTPNASYAGLAPIFDTLAIYSRNPASLDEFTILTVVPEPASPLLLGMGIAGALWAGRGRQTRLRGWTT